MPTRSLECRNYALQIPEVWVEFARSGRLDLWINVHDARTVSGGAVTNRVTPSLGNLTEVVIRLSDATIGIKVRWEAQS